MRMKLKPSYKQTEVGVIPEEWDVVRFSELFEFHFGRLPSL
jgi:type I restriction enzyme S subunit